MPFLSGHLAVLTLQFALGVLMICSGNYYRGKMMMMSCRVSVQWDMCWVLLAPSCCLTAAPLNLVTAIFQLFRMQRCHIVSCQVPTDSPLPHQHGARSETPATLKSRSSFLEEGLVVSLLPEERWDICSLNRFFYFLLLAESPLLSPKYKTLNV